MPPDWEFALKKVNWFRRLLKSLLKNRFVLSAQKNRLKFQAVLNSITLRNQEAKVFLICRESRDLVRAAAFL
jgi:hypothetical protein